MTDKIQKIREEVEGIVDGINPFSPNEDGKNSDFENGRLAMVTHILQYIDSMQEEPVSDDLEEEIIKIRKHHFINDDWDKREFDGIDISNMLRHIAQWQKEQLMKDAIKCEITWMDGFMLNYTQEQQDDLLEKIGAKVGDKVKVIIVKED